MSSNRTNTTGGIHGHLLKLHQSLSDEDKQAAAVTCHDIVGDLGQECMETPTENELGKTIKSIIMSSSVFHNRFQSLLNEPNDLKYSF